MTEPKIKDWDELTNEERAALDAACTPAHIANQHLLTGLCEDPPKYDPCRKFRKGDNVSPCFWNDRPPTAYDINELTSHFMPEDGLYKVYKDEFSDSTVLVGYKGTIISMQACHLELMTPVEELEPYSVHETDYLYRVIQSVDGGEQVVCEYRKNTHPNARAAAEAECARLNEEIRKKKLDVLKRQNEEPESYGLSSHTDGKCVDWHVTEKDGFICTSFHARPHGAYTPSAAREAAQAERDRLNAENRKEQR